MAKLVNRIVLLPPKKKFRLDRLVGEISGVVFVFAVCVVINYFPDNGIVYCRASNVEVIQFMLMSMVSQRVINMTLHRVNIISSGIQKC